MPFSFTFGDAVIHYRLSFKPRKRACIKILPDASVEVSAPLDVPLEQVTSWVEQKAPWISKQQRKVAARPPLLKPPAYLQGETHHYLGRAYRLRFQVAARNQVTVTHGWITLSHQPGTQPAHLFQRWYRSEAKRHFGTLMSQALPHFAPYGLTQLPAWQVRSMRTRWGSCTAQGRITLNLDLLATCKGCIYYVVVHELCHLIQHNHSPAFYALQSRILPDWPRWRKELDKTPRIDRRRQGAKA